MIDTLTQADFAACLGDTFRVQLDSNDVLDVELIEATVKPVGGEPASGGAKREPFSLVFRGPKDRHLPQKIYQLDHDRLGQLHIFLVPIGPDESGMCFEAIFT